VSWVRGFTARSGSDTGTRNVEDAPQSMRQELIDLFFSLAEHNQEEIPPDHVYRVICQSLGISPSGSPYSGYRYASGRDVRGVEWPRIYDLISRLWPDFNKQGFGHPFRDGVNRILAAHFIAWELGEDGQVVRVLPTAAQVQITAAFAELNAPQYAPSLALFNAARLAYDDRPRRDRDACTNIFDAMESVAKIKYNRPTDTFGQVKNHIEQNNLLRAEIIEIFQGLNQLRNQNFGHGMVVQFGLTGAEVDFTYLTCIGAILLMTRTP
jgi:hypothetical protein